MVRGCGLDGGISGRCGVLCAVRCALHAAGSKKESEGEGDVVVMHCSLVVADAEAVVDGMAGYEGSLGPHVTVRPGAGQALVLLLHRRTHSTVSQSRLWRFGSITYI